ncbi:MAG TPA: glutaredoxin family protein [Dehalococcoidia bacterium]|nr:glutaredoxin family protein [Dehalococcoidia bacterium]
MTERAAPVVVYSSPLCGACEELKDYLRERGVAFSVRDVLVDEAAMDELERRLIFSTPALSVGDTYVEMPDRARVDALLGLS